MEILTWSAGITNSWYFTRENQGKIVEYQTNYQRYLCKNLKKIGTNLDRCWGEKVIEGQWKQDDTKVQYLSSFDEGHRICCEECHKYLEKCVSPSQEKWETYVN